MDLDIKRVIKSIPKDHGPEELAPLTTPWGDAIEDVEVVYTTHPRPLFARSSWQTLDGWWDCAFALVQQGDPSTLWKTAEPPRTFSKRIRVPFSPEASLSGIGRQFKPNEYIWYRRIFATPAIPQRGSCMLHFDGVDFACAIYVNGEKVGEHEGAYMPFAIDITEQLHTDGDEDNELLVCVYDPSDTGVQLRGKQSLNRGNMWYTAQCGIWQSVWLEMVPRTRVETIVAEPDIDTGKLTVSVRANGIAMLAVEVIDEGKVIADGIQSRRVGGYMTLEFDIPDPHLWTLEDPYLYDIRVSYGEDVVESYVAFRTLELKRDLNGCPRICLNHKPIFLRGVLDQGYWPDGLMTPPSMEAMAFDIHTAKAHGFNMLRKHVKVESERFYELCDRLGMLVMQDMPSGGAVPSKHWSRDVPTMWRRSWHTQSDSDERGRERMGSNDETYQHEWALTCEDVITRLRNHPCVVAWVLFNESWGQFDSALATKMALSLDLTRPVLSCSGWYDQGVGDIHGVHNYFRETHMFYDPYVKDDEPLKRAEMITEFGGLTWRVEGHSQLDHTYGYAEFETIDEWRDGLDNLLADTEALEGQGLAGYVYTQLTDVEEETNGLLTYDRRVDKLKVRGEKGPKETEAELPVLE